MSPKEEMDVRTLLISHMDKSEEYQKFMNESISRLDGRITRQSAKIDRVSKTIHGDEEEEREGLVQKMDKMNIIIAGDESTDTDGLVQKVKKNSSYIETDKKLKWTAAGIGITGFGSIIAYIKSIF